MTMEKKIDALEGEFKLMKGELKHTLISIRDFLLNARPAPLDIEEVPETDSETLIPAEAYVPPPPPQETDDDDSPLSPGPAEDTVQPPSAEMAVDEPEPPEERSEAVLPPLVEDEDNTVPPLPEAETVEGQVPGTGEEALDDMGTPPPIEEVEDTAPPSAEMAEGPAPQPPLQESAHPVPQPQGPSDFMVEETVVEEDILDEPPAAAGYGAIPCEEDIHSPLPFDEGPLDALSALDDIDEVPSLPPDDAPAEARPPTERPQGARREAPPQARKEERMKETNGSLSQMNSLANLIRWVSSAKKEIGTQQLPTFLEAFRAHGPLPAEMKELILHLAVVVEEPPERLSPAEIWSRLALELHAILQDGAHQ